MRRAFTATQPLPGQSSSLPESEIIEKNFRCAANYKHIAFFALSIHGGTIQKIGQYPSRSDLTQPKFAKYRRISEEIYRELVRAANLAAADVHIAAFVYLRRIFERLVKDAAAAKAAANTSWSRTDWETKRMGEKIDELALHLPEFLIKNKAKLYGILSKGIHELSEEDCALYFPIMSAAIESVLDNEIERRTQLIREKETEKALSKIKI